VNQNNLMECLTELAQHASGKGELVKLDVLVMSGESLANFEVVNTSTALFVCRQIQKMLPAHQQVHSLILPDGRLWADSQTLLECGIVSGVAPLNTVIIAVSLLELKLAGQTASDLFYRGYSAHSLREVGFPLAELLEAGFDVSDVKHAGYNVNELRSAGCTAGDLHWAGYTASELRGLYSIFDLKVAGYVAADLLRAGYRVSDLMGAGFTITDLRRGFDETGYNN